MSNYDDNVIDACHAEAEAFELGAVSPDKAKQELDDVHGEFERFNTDVQKSKASDKFKAAWTSFFAQYNSFYHENAEGVIAWFERFLTSGAYKQAKEYRCRLRAWRDALKKEDPTATVAEPPRDTVKDKGMEGTAKWVAIGALAGLGLLAMFKR